MRSKIAPLVFAALLLNTVGCVSWHSVKASEIPKIGNMTVGVVSSGAQRGKAIAVSVAKLETPEGKLIEIKGKPDLRITVGGSSVKFSHPITASIEGGNVIIKSSNRAPMTIPIRSIQRVEVSQPSVAGIVAVSLLATLAGIALAMVLIFML
jgi:hypothetical protein